MTTFATAYLSLCNTYSPEWVMLAALALAADPYFALARQELRDAHLGIPDDDAMTSILEELPSRASNPGSLAWIAYPNNPRLLVNTIEGTFRREYTDGTIKDLKIEPRKTGKNAHAPRVRAGDYVIIVKAVLVCGGLRDADDISKVKVTYRDGNEMNVRLDNIILG